MSVEIVDAPKGVFAARITGQLRSSEYKQLQQRAAEFIRKHGSARILIETQDFEGFDRGNWEDNSFQLQFDQHIEKIAIVGDKTWEDLVLMFTGKGLREVAIEYFLPKDLDKAKAWLGSENP